MGTIKEVKWSGSTVTNFTGRNGFMKCSGVELMGLSHIDHGGAVMIAPLTSKGSVGRCDIIIPLNAIEQIVVALTEVKKTMEETNG